jgi:polyisoprenoid-binding protein YceI
MLRLLAFALALAAVPGVAAAAEYTIDPVHTDADFTVVHLAVSKVHGSIPLTAGTLTIGADDLPSAGTATFDMKNVSSGDDRRDQSLRGPNFFDVTTYPTMTFVVRTVSGTPQAFALTGDLTLHGVTKPVTLKASEVGSAIVRGQRHIGYTATTSIDRRDFGMTWGNMPGGALIAGFDVAIDIDIDTIQQ